PAALFGPRRRGQARDPRLLPRRPRGRRGQLADQAPLRRLRRAVLARAGREPKRARPPPPRPPRRRLHPARAASCSLSMPFRDKEQLKRSWGLGLGRAGAFVALAEQASACEGGGGLLL